MATTDPLHCPFCGYFEYVVIEFDEDSGFYTATCHNCVSAGCPAPNRDEAIRFWNKRHDPRTS